MHEDRGSVFAMDSDSRLDLDENTVLCFVRSRKPQREAREAAASSRADGIAGGGITTEKKKKKRKINDNQERQWEDDALTQLASGLTGGRMRPETAEAQSGRYIFNSGRRVGQRKARDGVIPETLWICVCNLQESTVSDR